MREGRVKGTNSAVKHWECHLSLTFTRARRPEGGIFGTIRNRLKRPLHRSLSTLQASKYIRLGRVKDILYIEKNERNNF